MDSIMSINIDNYRDLLKHYIESQDEKSLYRAEQISKIFLKNDVPPEEIVNLHNQALATLYPELFTEFQSSMKFLLEIMIFYGLAHQEFRKLREDQLKLKSELAVAADMQETFLATQKPVIDGIDIGAISVAAGQMNGDYYHFYKGNDGSLGISIADVIGKGVPAALCMSMIKFAMEMYIEDLVEPAHILKALNRVVEKNVDNHMFITMFYGQYLPSKNLLRFSSAGHEPGFHFQAKNNKFHELSAKGIVLGVMPDALYEQYEISLETDDMIILLTDGVTECRQGEDFIEREEVLQVIEQYSHLKAQDQVEEVFKHFERLQDFQLKDDFTLIILRKTV